jgi:hypothetical protein
MKRYVLPSADRDEIASLTAGNLGATELLRLVARISLLPPAAIHHVAGMMYGLRPIGPVKEIDSAAAPVLIFSTDGFVREAALRALDPLPDAPFFLAALVQRLNDWAAPVRRAAEECAHRELPRLSADTIAGAAPFLLDRMLDWGRWRSPPAVVLDMFARRDVADELVVRFARAADIPARVLRAALRLGLLDDHLPAISRTAMRPEFRAIALKAVLNGEATWITHYAREWCDKTRGTRRRVPVRGRRPVPRPAPLDVPIRHGALDRSVLVRRTAAIGLVEHTASVSDVKALIALFDGETNASVRWYITYLAERAAGNAHAS